MKNYKNYKENIDKETRREIFYNANSKDEFNRVSNTLQANGFEWVGLNKNPSFEECKSWLHGNAKLVIHAFFNSINKKYEIQCGSRAIYNSYPQHRGSGIVVVDMPIGE